ncbi:hypothetical protein MTO96_015168 [Rhipicephalus appendiculatus]
MRVAGVVKDRVSCDRREDGHLQLDDLNEDCWSLVRRHLKVEDVKDPGRDDTDRGLVDSRDGVILSGAPLRESDTATFRLRRILKRKTANLAYFSPSSYSLSNANDVCIYV